MPYVNNSPETGLYIHYSSLLKFALQHPVIYIQYKVKFNFKICCFFPPQSSNYQIDKTFIFTTCCINAPQSSFTFEI